MHQIVGLVAQFSRKKRETMLFLVPIENKRKRNEKNSILLCQKAIFT